MDEAMHPLTLLSFGLYGETLPNQNGAPVRLVVPWKYGFKSIKSIVKITIRGQAAAHHLEYHESARIRLLFEREPASGSPAMESGSERRIGEFFKRKTLMFNGYGDQVASLYTGMDLKKNY